MGFPNTSTQFAPGQSGNPGGYSKGRRLAAALNELIDENGDLPVLAKVWLDAAKAGDYRFFRELLDRVDGPIEQAIKQEHTGELIITVNHADGTVHHVARPARGTETCP